MERRISTDWELQNYLTVFIDILGQKNKILNLTHLPKTDEEKQEAIVTISDTAGLVRDLRSYFFEFCKATRENTHILDNLPPEQRGIAEHLRKCTVEWRGVSDSIIITVPLGYGNEYGVPMCNIFSALFSICGIFIVALSKGKAIRGGADIGWGVRIPYDDANSGDNKEVYGGTLVKAYSLESEIARYPRIVIGDSLFDYISSVKNYTSKVAPLNYDARFANKKALECLQLITQDYDRLRILDVIGTYIRSNFNGIQPTCVEQAYKFIMKSYNDNIGSNELKLATHYGLLKDYFESRLSIWGVSPILS